jgi:hypothetical protein
MKQGLLCYSGNEGHNEHGHVDALQKLFARCVKVGAVHTIRCSMLQQVQAALRQAHMQRVVIEGSTKDALNDLQKQHSTAMPKSVSRAGPHKRKLLLHMPRGIKGKTRHRLCCIVPGRTHCDLTLRSRFVGRVVQLCPLHVLCTSVCCCPGYLSSP